MMKIKNDNSRRDFLLKSSLVGVGFMGLFNLTQSLGANRRISPLLSDAGYGPLKAHKDGILMLPEGFDVKVISTKGNKMSDGFFVPGRADGMATFKGNAGNVIVVRNHENSIGDSNEGPFGLQNELLGKIDKRKMYDYGKGIKPGMGCTTNIVFNEKNQEIETEFLSIAGTARNCAGGLTPWNTWITCEETVEKAGSADGYAEKDHGYNFEVPATDKIGLADPIPLIGMGRFNHEAVSVDPKTSIVYQTEDSSDGLIYRYIPNEPGKLAKGGRLQAMMIKEQKSCDTRNWSKLSSEKLPVGKSFDVSWVDLENIQSPENDLRLQGFDNGAAKFARGEGMWFGENELYFACTNGGHISKGQVFRYTPSEFEGTTREKDSPGKLELFIEPNNTEIVKSCDNLTIAPWGDIILCEDVLEPNLVGVTPAGEFYMLASNIGYKSEFAGAVFSPSGETLFLNIQEPGVTLAITGPWKKKS